MNLKKIYIEITNSCNYECSYCYLSKRSKRSLSVSEFTIIVQKIRPFTQYLYLHVMGEPFLHPNLGQILAIAHEMGFRINITTNGSLLEQNVNLLKQFPPHQINISLHDIEENCQSDRYEEVIEEIISTALILNRYTYINLRLWNWTKDKSSKFNQRCLAQIHKHFPLDNSLLMGESYEKSILLTENIHLLNAERFSWPDESKIPTQEPKTCYALKDHVAILSDGSVVPCCIDADAHLLLGNIFTDDFKTILQSPRAIRIRTGFAQKTAFEDFCKVCGFR